MQTLTPSVFSNCHASDHIFNMHAQCGTLTWIKREPFWRQCKSLPVCCKNWNIDYESMLSHLNIPTLQQRRLQLKASMMCQFVHSDSYIPEDVLLLHPSPTMTHVIVLISLFRIAYILEQMVMIYSFFPHITFSGTNFHLL